VAPPWGLMARGATLPPTGRPAVDDTLELLELYAAMTDDQRHQVLWLARQFRGWEVEHEGR
jgi:hypothetical protein